MWVAVEWCDPGVFPERTRRSSRFVLVFRDTRVVEDGVKGIREELKSLRKT